MKKILVAAFICLMVYKGSAQNKESDSLKVILSNTTDLKERYRLLDQIGTAYYKEGSTENPVDFSFEMLRIALQLKNDSMIARGYNVVGDHYALTRGDYNAGLEYFLKGVPYAEKIRNGYTLPSLYSDISIAYWLLGYPDEQLKFLHKAEESLPDSSHPGYDYLRMQIKVNLAFHYLKAHNPVEGLPLLKEAEKINAKLNYQAWTSFIQTAFGSYYSQTGDAVLAQAAFQKALALDSLIKVPWARFVFKSEYINFLMANKNYDQAIVQISELQEVSKASQNDYFRLASMGFLKRIFEEQHKIDSAYQYAKKESALKDTVFNQQSINRIQALSFNEEVRAKEEADQRKQQIRTTIIITAFAIFLLISLIFYRNSRQRKKANIILERTLSDLKATQSQLIQSEKMASLGELTAGIAHEIQNPLNFVNNFSEVSNELIDEMKDELSKGNYEDVNAIANDIKQNLEKINHHGKRADAIVKGMLQHSQSSSGKKEPTDINALAVEYLRMAYHGLRAKDKNLNAILKTEFEPSLEKINIIPQDIGRVLLNLYNNAFYAVSSPPAPNGGEKAAPKHGYEPTVRVSTKKLNDKILISVQDNGSGIDPAIVDKIFQPFFTTKPTGQGTGLGLSLAYDIVKAHGGEIKVETKEARPNDPVGRGVGTTFIIYLPVA